MVSYDFPTTTTTAASGATPKPRSSRIRATLRDILRWFDDGPSTVRVEFVCNLLHLCSPSELRFFGSCLEELTRLYYDGFRDLEQISNQINLSNMDQLFLVLMSGSDALRQSKKHGENNNKSTEKQDFDAAKLNHKRYGVNPLPQSFHSLATNASLRTRLIVSLSLLNSTNAVSANAFYKLLVPDSFVAVNNTVTTTNDIIGSTIATPDSTFYPIGQLPPPTKRVPYCGSSSDDEEEEPNNGMEFNQSDVLTATELHIFEEIILIYTLAVFHPAFTYGHKFSLSNRLTNLHQWLARVQRGESRVFRSSHPPPTPPSAVSLPSSASAAAAIAVASVPSYRTCRGTDQKTMGLSVARSMESRRHKPTVSRTASTNDSCCGDGSGGTRSADGNYDRSVEAWSARWNSGSPFARRQYSAPRSSPRHRSSSPDRPLVNSSVASTDSDVPGNSHLDLHTTKRVAGCRRRGKSSDVAKLDAPIHNPCCCCCNTSSPLRGSFRKSESHPPTVPEHPRRFHSSANRTERNNNYPSAIGTRRVDCRATCQGYQNDAHNRCCSSNSGSNHCCCCHAGGRRSRGRSRECSATHLSDASYEGRDNVVESMSSGQQDNCSQREADTSDDLGYTSTKTLTAADGVTIVQRLALLPPPTSVSTVLPASHPSSALLPQPPESTISPPLPSDNHLPFPYAINTKCVIADCCRVVPKRQSSGSSPFSTPPHEDSGSETAYSGTSGGGGGVVGCPGIGAVADKSGVTSDRWRARTSDSTVPHQQQTHHCFRFPNCMATQQALSLPPPSKSPTARDTSLGIVEVVKGNSLGLDASKSLSSPVLDTSRVSEVPPQSTTSSSSVRSSDVCELSTEASDSETDMRASRSDDGLAVCVSGALLSVKTTSSSTAQAASTIHTEPSPFPYATIDYHHPSHNQLTPCWHSMSSTLSDPNNHHHNNMVFSSAAISTVTSTTTALGFLVTTSGNPAVTMSSHSANGHPLVVPTAYPTSQFLPTYPPYHPPLYLPPYAVPPGAYTYFALPIADKTPNQGAIDYNTAFYGRVTSVEPTFAQNRNGAITDKAATVDSSNPVRVASVTRRGEGRVDCVDSSTERQQVKSSLDAMDSEEDERRKQEDQSGSRPETANGRASNQSTEPYSSSEKSCTSNTTRPVDSTSNTEAHTKPTAAPTSFYPEVANLMAPTVGFTAPQLRATPNGAYFNPRASHFAPSLMLGTTGAYPARPPWPTFYCYQPTAPQTVHAGANPQQLQLANFILPPSHYPPPHLPPSRTLSPTSSDMTSSNTPSAGVSTTTMSDSVTTTDSTHGSTSVVSSNAATTATTNVIMTSSISGGGGGNSSTPTSTLPPAPLPTPRAYAAIPLIPTPNFMPPSLIPNGYYATSVMHPPGGAATAAATLSQAALVSSGPPFRPYLGAPPSSSGLQTMSRRPSFHCFGCSQPGHKIVNCPMRMHLQQENTFHLNYGPPR